MDHPHATRQKKRSLEASGFVDSVTESLFVLGNGRLDHTPVPEPPSVTVDPRQVAIYDTLLHTPNSLGFVTVENVNPGNFIWQDRRRGWAALRALLVANPGLFASLLARFASLLGDAAQAMICREFAARHPVADLILASPIPTCVATIFSHRKLAGALLNDDAILSASLCRPENFSGAASLLTRYDDYLLQVRFSSLDRPSFLAHLGILEGALAAGNLELLALILRLHPTFLVGKRGLMNRAVEHEQHASVLWLLLNGYELIRSEVIDFGTKYLAWQDSPRPQPVLTYLCLTDPINGPLFRGLAFPPHGKDTTFSLSLDQTAKAEFLEKGNVFRGAPFHRAFSQLFEAALQGDRAKFQLYAGYVKEVRGFCPELSLAPAGSRTLTQCMIQSGRYFELREVSPWSHCVHRGIIDRACMISLFGGTHVQPPGAMRLLEQGPVLLDGRLLSLQDASVLCFHDQVRDAVHDLLDRSVDWPHFFEEHTSVLHLAAEAITSDELFQAAASTLRRAASMARHNPSLYLGCCFSAERNLAIKHAMACGNLRLALFMIDRLQAILPVPFTDGWIERKFVGIVRFE